MIELRGIRLINWYAFGYETVPVGKFTLIAGKNGNGKSVILDAIRYSLYGDVKFNISTDKKGDRTLCSYTRGLLDATANTYIRPAEKYAVVISHIFLEMNDTEMKKNFVLGTIIETDSANATKTNRIILEGKSLSDTENTFQENGGELPYTASEFSEKYGTRIFDATEGILRFMQITGLRFGREQLTSFRRKLRSIISYDPTLKIDAFIRQNVLADRTVDFEKLIEAKNNIDSLKAAFDRIDNEIKELDIIISFFGKVNSGKRRLLQDDIEKVYKAFKDSIAEIKKLDARIAVADRQKELSEKKIKDLQERERATISLLERAKNNLREVDGGKAVDACEKELMDIVGKRDILAEEKDKLEQFQQRVSESLNWLFEQGKQTDDEKYLSALLQDEYSAAEKEGAVERYKKSLDAMKDDFIEDLTRIKDSLSKNRQEQMLLQKRIHELKNRQTTFSEIPDYVRLRDQINAELKKRGSSGEARFACEYVLRIRDEKWRDAIETFLGRKRYTILVDPSDYDIADDVLNRSKNVHAHVFNTALLMKEEIELVEGSAYELLEVKGAVAQTYFKYQLGRMHAVGISDVRKYKNAISLEGRVSVAMDGYYLDFTRLRFYCLGQKAIELNLKKALSSLKDTETQEKDLIERRELISEKTSYIKAFLGNFESYDYDAAVRYASVSDEYEKKKKELENLKKALENNNEYMELARLVDSYEKAREAIETELSVEQKSLNSAENDLNRARDRKDSCEIQRKESEERLNNYKIDQPDIHADALAAYDSYIERGEKGAGGILKDRMRLESEVANYSKILYAQIVKYNSTYAPGNGLPIDDEEEVLYKERRDRIWIDELQEAKDELDKQTGKYEEIFKKEFVLTILGACEDAKRELKRMNVKLSRLKFGAVYEFDVNYVRDGSDYEKILEYAGYLKEKEELSAGEGQLTFDALTKYTNEEGEKLEEEIRKIINKVISQKDRGTIERYADYKNYMTYEILISDESRHKAKLSRQVGFNSGAEVQIPYMLILISAMLIIYNEKAKSTRLVFIDEPFAKMDPANVKTMLSFMRTQGLQMIFCAPDKMETIGSECDVILPVLRPRFDMMEIGVVKLHDRRV